MQYSEQKLHPLFNNLVLNETGDDVEAEFLSSRFVIPGKSCFYMVFFNLLLFCLSHGILPKLFYVLLAFGISMFAFAAFIP